MDNTDIKDPDIKAKITFEVIEKPDPPKKGWRAWMANLATFFCWAWVVSLLLFIYAIFSFKIELGVYTLLSFFAFIVLHYWAHIASKGHESGGFFPWWYGGL